MNAQTSERSRAQVAQRFSPGFVSRLSRSPWPVLLLFCLAAMVLVGRRPVLRALGDYLVIDEPLAPSSAIVVLAGGTPQRETEAARLYRESWAERVIIVADHSSLTSAVEPTSSAGGRELDLRRRTLLGLGVPDEAIVVTTGPVHGTTQELAVARTAVNSAEPVILVTSKFHTRRVQLTWDLLTSGQPRGIVRGAALDPFDPSSWWTDQESIALVEHEYLGLLELLANPVLSTTQKIARLVASAPG